MEQSKKVTRPVCINTQICICSALSKNRYNSGIALRTVGILTLSADSGIVPDNSRDISCISIRRTSLRKVGIVGPSENGTTVSFLSVTFQFWQFWNRIEKGKYMKRRKCQSSRHGKRSYDNNCRYISFTCILRILFGARLKYISKRERERETERQREFSLFSCVTDKMLQK